MSMDLHRELDAVLALGRLSRDDVGGKVEFSGEDPLTEHKGCPGDVGSKEWWIRAISKRMAELSPGEHESV